MDCGPAVLAALLMGLGLRADYNKLREVCFTDVDGTSIDTIEELASHMGLDALQVVVPRDHLPIEEAHLLPAVALTHTPEGLAHFVLVWRRRGRRLEVMDPAIGRRWVEIDAFLADLYHQDLVVPAADFEDWARTPDFSTVLAGQLMGLGMSRHDATRRVEDATNAERAWAAVADLDTACRLTTALLAGRAITRGRSALRTFDRAREVMRDQPELVPERFVAVSRAGNDDQGGLVKLSGTVLVRVRGLDDGAETTREISRARLVGESQQPVREAMGLVARPARATVVVAAAFSVVAGGLAAALALPLRAAITSGSKVAISVVAAASLLLLIGHRVAFGSARQVGSRLDTELRSAVIDRLGRISDRYTESRPDADLAERVHLGHKVRLLPEMGYQLTATGSQALVAVVGLVAIYPPITPLVIALVAVAFGIPYLFRSRLAEYELRARTLSGAMSQIQLDALLGAMPLRAHSGGAALAYEHGKLLAKWQGAQRALIAAGTRMVALTDITAFALAASIVFISSRALPGTSVLLTLFWSVLIADAGDQTATLFRTWTSMRAMLLRLLDPMKAPDDPAALVQAHLPPNVGCGAGTTFRGVAVAAGSHRILEDIDLEIRRGEHVAVIGPSGAGKSTLIGTFLGWHEIESGSIEIDGEELSPTVLAKLRASTAWVDPDVTIWDRPLGANLEYGAFYEGCAAAVPEPVGLDQVRRRLGDEDALGAGEGGCLLSGGEGQRVRVGRAFHRKQASLVLLDEAFRGLDWATRLAVVGEVRRTWAEATLICVTHDLDVATRFDRIVYIEAGRIVEDCLASDLGPRTAAFADAARRVNKRLWRNPYWRRITVAGGRIAEDRAGAPR